MVLAIIAAVAVFVAVASVLLVIVNPSPSRSVERRLGKLQTSHDDKLESVLRSDSGTFPFLRRLLGGSAWSESAAQQLQRAGSGLKVSEYLLARLFMAGILAVLAAFVFRGSSLMLLFVLGAGLIGFMVPAWLLNYAQSRRVATINKQLAETLSLISNALRSGFAFSQSVELAAKQIDPPIRDELLRYLRDVSLGAPADVALQDMASRTASYDLEMMVATILVQRNTGGNLSEILDNVAETVRERERIAGEIRALTASQRLTGLILSIYPVFLAVIFFILAPTLMKVLWEEELGRFLLAAALTLQIIGIVTIRRILRPEI